MKWYNVKECMPPVEEEYVKTQTVLVTDGTYITCAYYALSHPTFFITGAWYMPDELCHNSNNATYLPIEPVYWAHIPDLPKVEESEE